MADYDYPLDVTGLEVSNKIENEDHSIQPPAGEMSVFIVPNAAPFFRQGLIVEMVGGSAPLVEGQDYYLGHRFYAASNNIGREIFGSIVLINRNLSGTLRLKQYQTLGGAFTLDNTEIVEDLTKSLYALRVVTWDQVLGVPVALPTIEHQEPVEDLKGWGDAITALQELVTAAEQAAQDVDVPPADVDHTFKQPWILTTQSNLNGITGRGYYMATTTNAAAVSRNFPAEGVTGMLAVLYDDTDTGIIVQEYKQTRNPSESVNAGLGEFPVEWRRISSDGGQSWSVWERIDAQTILATAQPVPAGAVQFFMQTTPPPGWLVVDGKTIGNASSNATGRANGDTFELFKILWDQNQPIYLSDGGVSTRGTTAQADFDAGKQIAMRDDRGLFLRAWNNTTQGHDADRNHGTYQGDLFAEHNHRLVEDGLEAAIQNTDTNGDDLSWVGQNDPYSSLERYTHTQVTGGEETRPKNRAYLLCVKY